MAFKDSLLVFRAQAIQGLFDNAFRVERHLVVDDGLSIRCRILDVENDLGANDAGLVGTEEKVWVIVQALPALARLAQHGLQVSERVEESGFSRRIRAVDRGNGKHTVLATQVERLAVASLLARNHREVDRLRKGLPVVEMKDSQHHSPTFPFSCKNSTSFRE